MPHLRYEIAPEIFQHHPGYQRGVLVFDGLDNGGAAPQLQALLRSAETMARSTVPTNVAEFAPVVAWRDAYRRFGAKPSEHRSAIEALLRRVLKGDPLPSVNTLVDIGNWVSVQHSLPASVHPLGSQDDHLQLRAAGQADWFLPPDGGAPETPPPGEVVLARGHEVLTRRWTWRQAAGTRIETSTTCVFINIDGLPPINLPTLQAAMQATQTLMAQYAGGRLVCSGVLSSQHPVLEAVYTA